MRNSLLSLFVKWTGLSEYILPPNTLSADNDLCPNVPLMSLPMIFKTDHHTIPASVPYLIQASSS